MGVGDPQHQHLNTTIHDGERYESGLLWKVDHPIYKTVIDTYVNSKHARKLTHEEIDAGPNGRNWYCPHHPVFNPNKPGKGRVVFDLSDV